MPLCSVGTPEITGGIKPAELENFANYCEEDEKFQGFMVSSEEVEQSITQLVLDANNERLWFVTESRKHIYFVPTEIIPSDFLQALKTLCDQSQTLAVYVVDTTTQTDSPKSES